MIRDIFNFNLPIKMRIVTMIAKPYVPIFFHAALLWYIKNSSSSSSGGPKCLSALWPLIDPPIALGFKTWVAIATFCLLRLMVFAHDFPILLIMPSKSRLCSFSLRKENWIWVTRWYCELVHWVFKDRTSGVFDTSTAKLILTFSLIYSQFWTAYIFSKNRH